MKYALMTFLLCLSLGGFADISMKILQTGVVADRLPTGTPINPLGLAILPDGELLALINDSTDVVPPSKVYLVRSRDFGKNWSKPELVFTPEDDKIGLSGQMFQLPDQSLLVALLKMWHTQIPKHHMDVMKQPLRRYSTIELYRSTDGGRSWKKFHSLTSEGEYLAVAVNGSLLKLPNGDLLLPGYLSLPLKNKQAVQGSGFWRSKDGGKTWGKFEKSFTNLPGKSFNEATYTLKADGTIVGFARWDSASQLTESMYKTISKDNGKTWSEPVETQIKGIYPVSIKLPNGIYILMCGLRNDPMRDRIIHFYGSTDGENFKDLGRPYYFKPEHRKGLMDSAWGTTGGAQYLIPVGENTFYAVFNGGSPYQKAPYQTYVDGNLIQVVTSEPEKAAAVPADSLLNPASWKISGGKAVTVFLDGKPALKITGPAVLESKRLWAADPDKDRVQFSGMLRADGKITGINYFGVRCFKDQNNVVHPVFWTVAQSATELVESCRAEDMVLKVKDTSKWWRSSYFRVKIGNYVTGRDLGMVEKKNGYSLVHFQQPCGVTMPAGTPVHLFCRGTADVFFADILRGLKDWRCFDAVTQLKVHSFSPRHLRSGTKYIRILMKLNQGGDEDTVLYLKDLNFSEIK